MEKEGKRGGKYVHYIYNFVYVCMYGGGGGEYLILKLLQVKQIFL